jgi:hypothetical protein
MSLAGGHSNFFGAQEIINVGKDETEDPGGMRAKPVCEVRIDMPGTVPVNIAGVVLICTHYTSAGSRKKH